MTQAKVWFVTGASGGFGRIWTEAALQRGDYVVATARDTASLQPLVEAHGEAVLPIALDVTDTPAVFAAVRDGHRRFGRLNVILCNAGYGYMSTIEEIEFDEARKNIDTNLFGTLAVIQAALPILREQRSGHILTMSSIGGLASFPTGGIYLASKFAVEAVTEALAGEVAAFGIKVTAIEPGSFSTGFGSSTKTAPRIGEYDELRTAARASFKPEMTGDPQATTAAILALVDADAPPRRLMLGDWLLPMMRKVYQDRLTAWGEWADISNAAQGRGTPADPATEDGQ